jgi:hypothetical protein
MQCICDAPNEIVPKGCMVNEGYNPSEYRVPGVQGAVSVRLPYPGQGRGCLGSPERPGEGVGVMETGEEYDPDDDLRKSVAEARRLIRQRVSRGGRTWTPEPCRCQSCNLKGTKMTQFEIGHDPIHGTVTANLPVGSVLGKGAIVSLDLLRQFNREGIKPGELQPVIDALKDAEAEGGISAWSSAASSNG